MESWRFVVTGNWIRALGVAALLAPLSVGRGHAGVAVEVVFCVDATSSMAPEITAVRERIGEVMERLRRLAGGPLRVGVVAYRDLVDPEPLVFLDLTEDSGLVERFVSELVPSHGGADIPEDVAYGLQTALERTSWSEEPETLRQVFLIGDAPAKEDPDRPGLLELADQALRGAITIHAYTCGCLASDPELRREWEEVARRTYGEVEVLPRQPGSWSCGLPGGGAPLHAPATFIEVIDSDGTRRGVTVVGDRIDPVDPDGSEGEVTAEAPAERPRGEVGEGHWTDSVVSAVRKGLDRSRSDDP